MIRLAVQSGPLKGRVFLLPPGLPAVIGRGARCFVRLQGRGVSRRHALLVPAATGWLVEDAGSTNGTFVNGERIDHHLLRTGDVVRVGSVTLSYSVEEEDPLVGKELVGHRILARLGGGGSSTVYRALQVSMDRIVALKVLSEELSRDGDYVSRFVGEARAMARLSHPRVVQVHTVGQSGSLFYLCMEFMEGGSLRGLLDREGRQPVRRALTMARDAAEALIWAEEQGIVHRDVKPGNLMLDAGGRVKVGDFGLALDRTRASGAEGSIIGSPHFMAPEQGLGRSVDHRADIYALGSTLYVTLSGKNPFAGRTVREVVFSKMSSEPTPLTQLVPGLPQAVQALVSRAMARDPEWRFQSAAELHRDLGRVLGSIPDGATTTGARHRPASWRRRTAAGLAASAAVLAVLAFVAHVRGPGERGPTTKAPPVAEESPEPPPDGAAPRREAAPETGSPPSREVDPAVEATAVAGVEPSPLETEPLVDEAAEAEPTDLLDESIEGLLLESRFAEARAALAAFRNARPSLGGKVDAALARVRAAEALFTVRREAIALEREGKRDAALEALRKIAPSLPEPYAGEARAAAKALEGRRDAGG